MLFKRQLVAECLGTFALVFAGTGAIIVNDISGGAITQVGIALTFGFIVMGMVYALGNVSGAHLNPAVTIGFVVSCQFPAKNALLYIASQCIGALLASAMLYILFPGHATLGATLPAGSVTQSFILECLLTFFLMFVILSVSMNAKGKKIIPAIAIGSVVALEALFAGPISGASMNPARSFAPALISGHMESLWLYLIAPIIGSTLAMLACRCIHESPCCMKLPKRACS